MSSTPKTTKDEIFLDQTLRPNIWSDYIGQENIKTNLKILLTAAEERAHPAEHILFYGPPGLGKTTLAHLIAKETKRQIKITSGPAIEKVGDLASILTNLAPGDIVFIDEIHRLNKMVEEILYPAMESGVLDIKHIGIVAASPEGSAFCYRRIGRRVSEIERPDLRPTVSLHTCHSPRTSRSSMRATGRASRRCSASRRTRCTPRAPGLLHPAGQRAASRGADGRAPVADSVPEHDRSGCGDREDQWVQHPRADRNKVRDIRIDVPDGAGAARDAPAGAG